MTSEQAGSTRAPIIPGTVTSSITVDASLDRVWDALTRHELRGVWGRLPGHDFTHELDFRPGGSERRTSTFTNIDHDERLELSSRFVEIVDRQRLVVVEELRMDDDLRTASIVAWELSEVDASVRVDFTENYLLLLPTGDGSAEAAERKGGVPMMLRGFAITVQERT